ACNALPDVARSCGCGKKGESRGGPGVPCQMLTAVERGTPEWTEIARRAPWQMQRMHLNTFARHGVFGQPGLTELIADRLRDPNAIAKARVFPYQLLMAYTMANANAECPKVVCDAL